MKSLCGGSTQPRKQPIVRLSLNLTSYCTGIASVPASFIYLWAGNTDQTSLKAASKIYHLRSREHIVFCSPHAPGPRGRDRRPKKGSQRRIARLTRFTKQSESDRKTNLIRVPLVVQKILPV